jgi:hypothetical protein
MVPHFIVVGPQESTLLFSVSGTVYNIQTALTRAIGIGKRPSCPCKQAVCATGLGLVRFGRRATSVSSIAGSSLVYDEADLCVTDQSTIVQNVGVATTSSLPLVTEKEKEGQANSTAASYWLIPTAKPGSQRRSPHSGRSVVA